MPQRTAPTRRAALTAALLALSVIAGCNDYGRKIDVDGSDVYYKNVSREEAEKLGAYLKKIKWITSEKKVSVQLNKEGETYQVRLVVVDDYKSKGGYPLVYQRMAAVISRDVFDDKPVEIHLANEKLKTLETITMDSIGRLLAFGDSELFYTAGVAKKEAGQIGDLLKKIDYFGPKKNVAVQLRKDKDGYQLGFVVVDDYKQKIPSPIPYQIIGMRVSKEVFGGKPVQVQFLDGQMKVREVLKPLAKKSQ